MVVVFKLGEEMKFLFFIVTIAFSMQVFADVNSKWDHLLNKIPKSTVVEVKDLIKCYSLGGDQLSKDEMKIWKHHKCDRKDEILQRLRTEYVKNQNVIDILNCIESNPLAKESCPD